MGKQISNNIDTLCETYAYAERKGRKKALDEAYVNFINRNNDDSFLEWLQENILDD